VPIEDTVGAIADMAKAGYVPAIRLSEVNAGTIRRAAAVHPICDVQDRIFADRADDRGGDPAGLPGNESGSPPTAFSRGCSGHWTKASSGGGSRLLLALCGRRAG
jgi:hypothetical protein